VRNGKGQLVSDGRLAVYKKENLGQGAERETEEATERNPQGAEDKPTSTLYAILDRTGQLGDEDTLVLLNVPIPVFITGDLAFSATVVGKEGMDKAHCHWCKLPSAQWQTYGHAPGPKWTLEELK
jgi:hypothetical protein